MLKNMVPQPLIKFVIQELTGKCNKSKKRFVFLPAIRYNDRQEVII